MRPVLSALVARPLGALAVLLTVATLAGCHRWVPASSSPIETVRGARPGQVLVRRVDGSTVTLRNPRVVTDTTRALGTSGAEPGASDTLIAGELVGRTLATGESARGGGSRNATVLVRASEIRSIETRETSRWRTATFAGIVAGAIIASLVAFSR